MADLTETISQTISDFDDIKEAIEEKGVAVPYDTDTSEYGKLIKKIPQNSGGGVSEAFLDEVIAQQENIIAIQESLIGGDAT